MRSPVASKSMAICSPPFFFGAGIGMKDSLGRRPGLISPVGPFGPITKWRSGAT